MGSFFRKPLGLFVAIVVVGLVLIAGGMKALGGTSDGAPHPATPLTPAQFKRASLHFCLSVRAEVKAIIARGKPRNLREATADIRDYTRFMDRMTAELNALVPPPAAAASFGRERRKLDAFDGAMHRLDHLAETRQWRRFVFLVRSKWWKGLVKGFGPSTNPKHMRCSPAGPLRKRLA